MRLFWARWCACCTTPDCRQAPHSSGGNALPARDEGVGTQAVVVEQEADHLFGEDHRCGVGAVPPTAACAPPGQPDGLADDRMRAVRRRLLRTCGTGH